MLRKLMKHEFRATGRIMLPMFLLVLVTSVGANISTRTLLETDHPFLNIVGVVLLGSFTIAIASTCIMTVVLAVNRFYKNILRDEGYVMMTLPVSVHQQVWAKLLVSLVWFLATAAVVALGGLILVFRIDLVESFWAGMQELLRALFINANIPAINAWLFYLEIFVLMIAGCLQVCLQFYSAMAIGHSFSKHKILWSIASYFGIDFVLDMLGAGIMIMLDVLEVNIVLAQMPINPVTHTILLATLSAAALIGAFHYFLTTFFLKKRLNLE